MRFPHAFVVVIEVAWSDDAVVLIQVGKHVEYRVLVVTDVSVVETLQVDLIEGFDDLLLEGLLGSVVFAPDAKRFPVLTYDLVDLSGSGSCGNVREGAGVVRGNEGGTGEEFVGW